MFLIALCGAPHSGKTEVQKYLTAYYDIQPVDDGWPMRDFAINNCGLTKEDVLTEEGKRRIVRFPGGREMTVRKFLGELGLKIDELLGEDAIPEMALLNLNPHKNHSFGSVRRDQGRLYKARGGFVLEIQRPGMGFKNEFDRFNPANTDHVIVNDGTLGDLYAKVDALLNSRFPMLRKSGISS